MYAVVKTRSGEIRGAVVDGAHVFKGIPYAAAPVGVNRLRPPQPVTPRSGVRDALAFGPKAPQPSYPPGMELFLPPELTGPGEDCLTLNIWTPDLESSAKHPVMVWIAGGLFEYHGTGASPWYDGSHFARDGVVCVTINYRVGAEGFLSLGEGNVNRGMLDQIAALAWVRDNITAFGGDPGNVTIFGESAGGMSVGTLLAMPRAEGLFHRAIIESGTAHHVTSAVIAQRITQYLAEKLGVTPTREAIAAVPLDRLLMVQEELKAEVDAHPDPQRWGEVVANALPFEPVIDGDSLPARPIERIAAGASADVAVLVGTNTEEWRLMLVASGAIEQITNEALMAVVAAYRLPAEAALATYRAARPGASAGDLLGDIQGDWYWRIPSMRLADAHAIHSANTYMYEFAWRSPQFNGTLGACHAVEIPFVFDTLGAGTEPLLGPNPPQQLADSMHAAWVAFATSGDPGWPAYDVERRATMRFDATSEVVDDPLSAKRALWEGLR
ncbi:MAG TPA: carboxylesterase/lipase family protein [Ktedonobacterales bacterium]|jgi:carboxylesterase type B|nr:carboxylesterase/lipase family protein [Ktedonobacterales bacterium]